MPPPSCQESKPKPSLLLALLCASVVAAYDRTWLARPVCALIPDGGPRPERVSRMKALLLLRLEALVAAASRRGRPRVPAPSPEAQRASLTTAMLAIATSLLSEVKLPRRRDLQDRLVCAYDRLAADEGCSLRDFCAPLAIPERTFRAWRNRPPRPLSPSPAPVPPAPRRRDRGTGRFALEVTAPGTQLGGDTTDLRIFGVDLKLVAAQDLGAREQRLWEAFALSEHETADLVASVVAEAAAGKEGLQLITDQGKPFVAKAARAAYDALGVEHAPQREGAPTEKATVERAFHTVKDALAPLLHLTNRLADAVPALAQPDLARHLGTLVLAVFLRVYAAGRRHLAHPLEGHDPAALVAIIEDQRDRARAEDRSVRLFLEGVHAEYAMPGSGEAFVRAFRHYPLEDLRDAERRFRAYACRCATRGCDRYFAAVVRDVHERGRARRAAERRRTIEDSAARHVSRDAAQRAADLDAHPERRLAEGLDLLADSWRPDEGRFLDGGRLAQIWLRRAIAGFRSQQPISAWDTIEASFRSWMASRPATPRTVFDAVRRELARLIPNIPPDPATPISTNALVGVILSASARRSTDNLRPTPSPHLRI